MLLPSTQARSTLCAPPPRARACAQPGSSGLHSPSDLWAFPPSDLWAFLSLAPPLDTGRGDGIVTYPTSSRWDRHVSNLLSILATFLYFSSSGPLHLDLSPLYLTQFACLSFSFWTTDEEFGNRRHQNSLVARHSKRHMGSCASGTTVHSAGSAALVRSQPRHCDNKMGKPQAIPSTPPPQGPARSLTRTAIPSTPPPQGPARSHTENLSGTWIENDVESERKLQFEDMKRRCFEFRKHLQVVKTSLDYYSG